MFQLYFIGENCQSLHFCCYQGKSGQLPFGQHIRERADRVHLSDTHLTTLLLNYEDTLFTYLLILWGPYSIIFFLIITGKQGAPNTFDIITKPPISNCKSHKSSRMQPYELCAGAEVRVVYCMGIKTLYMSSFSHIKTVCYHCG